MPLLYAARKNATASIGLIELPELNAFRNQMTISAEVVFGERDAAAAREVPQDEEDPPEA